MRIVVDRERVIRGFRKISHFGVELMFETLGKAWSAKWLLKPGFVTERTHTFWTSRMRSPSQATAAFECNPASRARPGEPRTLHSLHRPCNRLLAYSLI